MIQVLFLNDIAGTEILLILVFVLVFFGANSIPSIAKTMGRAIYQIKNASDDLKSEIKKSTGDIKKDLNLKELIKETEEDINLPMDQMMTDIEHTINYETKKPKRNEKS
jgi:sec-independent protein translocase protein TatA